MYKYSTILKNLEDTKNIAIMLSQKAQNGDTFLFNGDIGAGKTTFCQFFINALLPAQKVSSPTFSLINEYNYAKFKIYHMDLYRIKNQNELFELGFEELLHNNVCLIEWAENSYGYPINNPITLKLSQQNNIRQLDIIFSNIEQQNRFITKKD